ncbi:MAG: hypothetical protein ABIZ72_00045 [Candidatus Limnocylindrales bacterium]
MSITIRAVGQAGRRGATRRVPTAATVLGDIDDWLPGAIGDALIGHVAGARTPDGALEVGLHPAARPVRIEALDAGRVVVSARTVPVGPGYHTYVATLLDRLGDELGITWAKLATPDPAARGRVETAAAATNPGSSIDPTGAFGSGDRHDAERGHLGWLRSALTAVRDARRQGATGLHLATPPGTRFTFDGAVATVLGPRDDAWLERALGDPRVAADVWPWVADAMDARYLLGRALSLLWLDVRWRPPLGVEEAHVVEDVLGTLRRAYPLEPGLVWPWHAWRELFQLRGQPDPATRALLDRGAGPLIGGRADDEPRPIGYRRNPVTIVHEGWALDVPGSFTDLRSSEEWTGGEAGRSVTLAGTETAEGGHPMSADRFLQQVAGHLGRDALEHDDGVVRGRARLASDPSSGVEVATVEGFSAVRGRGAAIRIEIDDPQDWKWALDTWRGLRPA